MKNLGIFLILAIFFSACSPAPLEYYKRCVVNTVYVQHYGVTEILDILNHPGLKFNDKKKNFDTVSYTQIVQDKIDYAEELYKEVDNLKITTDAKQMIDASKDVLNTVIQGQKKYYMQLAVLKDKKTDPLVLQTTAFRLLDAPEKAFQQKMNLLWGYGKIYGDENELDLSVVSPSANK